MPLQLSVDEFTNTMQLVIEHIAKESGNNVESLTNDFNTLVKADAKELRYWISEESFGHLLSMPQGQDFIDKITAYNGCFSQDEWGEGVHIRFPKQDGTFADKLDIKDIIAVLLPETAPKPKLPETEPKPELPETAAKPELPETAAKPELPETPSSL
ncbi:hypothetical protein NIES4074_36240 [Cylindrospermum sp. NIES-4074]|nr:hypothetical protein NIES4074_36240 [Cylindrospermum sp. NIES-4074]